MTQKYWRNKMILNAIWQVPENRTISDLPERTIRVNNCFGEGLAWGKLTDFKKESSEVVLLRILNEDNTILVALSDLPFLIEVWNTDCDEPLQLNWTGRDWLVTETDVDYDEDQHTELQTKDVDFMVWSVCQKLGMTHMTQSQIRDRDVMIELVNRDLFSKLSLVQGDYFYRDLDADTFNYERDIENLPPIDEIDVLHFIGEPANGKDDFIYIFYDDDLPIEVVLSSLLAKKTRLCVEMLRSDSADIVDCINLVKDEIEFNEEEKETNFYIVETNENALKKFRLFFNMSSFYPKEAPYLV